MTGEEYGQRARYGVCGSHEIPNLGQRLASSCPEGAEVPIEGKKYLGSQAFHHGKTGSVHVAEVLIAILTQNLPGLYYHPPC